MNCYKKKIKSSELSSESKQIFKMLVEVFKSVTRERDNRVTEIDQEFKLNLIKLEESAKDKQQQIDQLKSDLADAKLEFSKLRSETTSLKNSQDEHDSYVRRETLIFSGNKVKPFQSNENCGSIARELIRNELQLDMDPLISTAHRVGKPPAHGSPDTRAIVVRFCVRDDKFKIIKTARERKVRGLYVNESLSPSRNKILFVLRKIKKLENSPVTGTSTHNGRVFVYTKPSATAPDSSRSIRTEINCKEKLSEFCTNFIKKPLENFLDSWD